MQRGRWGGTEAAVGKAGAGGLCTKSKPGFQRSLSIPFEGGGGVLRNVATWLGGSLNETWETSQIPTKLRFHKQPFASSCGFGLLRTLLTPPLWLLQTTGLPSALSSLPAGPRAALTCSWWSPHKASLIVFHLLPSLSPQLGVVHELPVASGEDQNS